MKIEQLRALVEAAGTQAKMVILGLHRPLMPTWVYIDPEGGPHVIGTPWTNEIEKRYYGWYIRTELQMHQATAYSFVCEAWSTTAPLGQPRTEPRLDPARREIVLAFATDGDQIEWKQWDIVRDHEDQVSALKETEVKGNHTSWLTQLLRKKHA